MKSRQRYRHEHGGMVAIASVIAFVILVGVGWVVYSWLTAKPPEPPAEGDVGIKGTTLCLPHKDTSGPQTLECAIGFKDQKGQHYFLRDLDPTQKNIVNLGMNNEVTIIGNFREESSDIYPIVGAIEISEIKY